MSLDLYEEHAKEKANLPVDWHVFKWECFPKGIDKTLYVEVTGAVCTTRYLRGGWRGQLNFRRRDRSTQKTIVLPLDEHREWKLQWEKKTGKCFECFGTGQEVASCSVTDGTKYRPCSRCKGAMLAQREKERE